ncbi:MAG TPA: GyrI-like domain-containing protein [Polyangiaceae bacterium]|nr:GyrI-like domain-containing protein [Polyangiaceae bacterium]
MNAIESGEIINADARRRDGRHSAGPAATTRCELQILEPRWAAVVRFRAALDQLPRSFFHRYATLAACILRNGQRPAGPPFAIFGRSDDNAVDVEAGLLLEDAMPPANGVEVKRLPEGLAVAVTHTGPYEQIGASYFELLEWMDGKSLGRDGPFMEVYLDGARSAESRHASTRIVVPVCAPARTVMG